MKYDPIKRSLGSFFNQTVFLRLLLYKLLDLLLLRAWYIKRALRQWSKSNRVQYVLDAGSGFGQHTYYLQSLFPNATIEGVDLKQEQIDDCNMFFSKAGKKNVRFLYADLTHYTPKQKYDLIVCVDVMEHIEDDVSVFNNFGKIINDGGLLLISTPSDKGGSDVHHEHEDSFIDEHVRDGYNKEDMIQKLKKAGFRDISVAYSYGKFGSIAWRLSMKYPIVMLNKSKLFFVILPVYYLITFPFAFLFNAIDTGRTNKTGTGLIVKAIK